MGVCQSCHCRPKNREKYLQGPRALAAANKDDLQPLLQGYLQQHDDWAVPRVPQCLHRLNRLGQGASAVVYRCEDPAANKHVAVKLFKYPYAEGKLPPLLMEVVLQARLAEQHPNILPITHVLLTTSHSIGIVTECARFGDLQHFMTGGGSLNVCKPNKSGELCLDEQVASFFFRQIASAVFCMHDHCIAHQDIKLQNVMVTGSWPPVLKLGDFGLACPWRPEHGPFLYWAQGTRRFAAPELNRHPNWKAQHPGYDACQADAWSLGVLLVNLLLGLHPFDGKTLQSGASTAPHYILNTQLNARSWREAEVLQRATAHFSPALLDLLDRILLVDPNQRLDVLGMLGHPWVTQLLRPDLQAAWEHLQWQERDMERRAPAVEPRPAPTQCSFHASCPGSTLAAAAASYAAASSPMPVPAGAGGTAAVSSKTHAQSLGKSGGLERMGSGGNALQAPGARAVSKPAVLERHNSGGTTAGQQLGSKGHAPSQPHLVGHSQGAKHTGPVLGGSHQQCNGACTRGTRGGEGGAALEQQGGKGQSSWWAAWLGGWARQKQSSYNNELEQLLWESTKPTETVVQTWDWVQQIPVKCWLPMARFPLLRQVLERPVVLQVEAGQVVFKRQGSSERGGLISTDIHPDSNSTAWGWR